MKGKSIDPGKPLDATVTRTIVEQLAILGLTPTQIGTIAVSHYHRDHIGRASDFPNATLVMGAADWQAVGAEPGVPGLNRTSLGPWLSDQAKVDQVVGDRDVFGDGTVRMISTPGHTPGHHSLLVKPQSRYILLTGDLANFSENYETDGVPQANTNRADTLASPDRVKALAANLHATVIIQHEPADIDKLPAFPEAAE